MEQKQHFRHMVNFHSTAITMFDFGHPPNSSRDAQGKPINFGTLL
jgi:hypothetical protein